MEQKHVSVCAVWINENVIIYRIINSVTCGHKQLEHCRWLHKVIFRILFLRSPGSLGFWLEGNHYLWSVHNYYCAKTIRISSVVSQFSKISPNCVLLAQIVGQWILPVTPFTITFDCNLIFGQTQYNALCFPTYSKSYTKKQLDEWISYFRQNGYVARPKC